MCKACTVCLTYLLVLGVQWGSDDKVFDIVPVQVYQTARNSKVLAQLREIGCRVDFMQIFWGWFETVSAGGHKSMILVRFW